MPYINVNGNKIEYRIKKGRSRSYVYIRAKEDVVEVVLPDERWLYFVDPDDIAKVYRKVAEKKRLITEDGFYFNGRWVSGKAKDKAKAKAKDKDKDKNRDKEEDQDKDKGKGKGKGKNKNKDAEEFLRVESRRYLEKAIRELSALMEVQPKSFKIVDTKYWGSCSARGVLSFNFRIACLPEDMREYLVVHELSHLKHFNHSKAFWSDVEDFCPGYRKIRRALKGFTF